MDDRTLSSFEKKIEKTSLAGEPLSENTRAIIKRYGGFAQYLLAVADDRERRVAPDCVILEVAVVREAGHLLAEIDTLRAQLARAHGFCDVEEFPMTNPENEEDNDE